MKTKLYALLLISSLTSQAFEYQASIEGIRTSGTEVELVKIPVEQAVYPNIRHDFKDLVILTKDKKSLPFSFVQNSLQTKKPYMTYQQVNVENVKIEKDSITLELNLSKPQKRSSLKISTPLKDFEFVVTLKTKTGQLIAEETIYDYSSFTNSRREIITFPSQVLQNLTVSIKGLTQLQTKALFEWREVSSGNGENKIEKTSKINFNKPRFTFALGTTKYSNQTQKLFEPVKQGLVSWQKEEKNNKTIITINTHKLPISAIRLHVDEKNFTRSFTVKSASKKNRVLKSGKIERWNYRKYQKNNTQINLNPFNSEKIILTIEHGKQTPLSIDHITFNIPQYCLYFLMEPTTAYSINFGDSLFKGGTTTLPLTIMNKASSALVGKMGTIKQKEVNIQTSLSKDYGFLITPIVLIIMALLAWVIFDTLQKTENRT